MEESTISLNYEYSFIISNLIIKGCAFGPCNHLGRLVEGESLLSQITQLPNTHALAFSS